jgi:hypothetical protein
MVDRAKLTSFPLPGDETNPLGVLAEASAALEREREVPGQADRGDERGREEKRVAGGSDADGMTTIDSDAGRERQPSTSQTNEPRTSNTTAPPADADAYYSRPKQGTAGQRTLQGEAPHIMALLTQADAQYLFDIYWQWFHPHLPLLDKDHSDPIDVASRSNYLFNASKCTVLVMMHFAYGRTLFVVCCCAARSFVPNLWHRLKDFAKAEMTRIPLEKTLDVSCRNIQVI